MTHEAAITACPFGDVFGHVHVGHHRAVLAVSERQHAALEAIVTAGRAGATADELVEIAARALARPPEHAAIMAALDARRAPAEETGR